MIKSQTNFDDEESRQQDDTEGLYYNIFGKEIKIVDNFTLKTGDVVGIRFDAMVGAIYFDINNQSLGIAYQGKELQEGVWFPTIDVGMGDDKVKILQPPKNLIDDITWKEAEEFVSRTTMMNVKRLSQLSVLLQKQIDLGYCS